jgi:hypothetical protein
MIVFHRNETADVRDARLVVARSAGVLIPLKNPIPTRDAVE